MFFHLILNSLRYKLSDALFCMSVSCLSFLLGAASAASVYSTKTNPPPTQYLMHLPSIILNILINSVTSQSINSTQPVSLTREKAQLAVNSFIFILSAPANCLETLADLPRSTSKNMAALWIRAVFHDAGTLLVVLSVDN